MSAVPAFLRGADRPIINRGERFVELENLTVHFQDTERSESGCMLFEILASIMGCQSDIPVDSTLLRPFSLAA